MHRSTLAVDGTKLQSTKHPNQHSVAGSRSPSPTASLPTQRPDPQRIERIWAKIDSIRTPQIHYIISTAPRRAGLPIDRLTRPNSCVLLKVQRLAGGSVAKGDVRAHMTRWPMTVVGFATLPSHHAGFLFQDCFGRPLGGLKNSATKGQGPIQSGRIRRLLDASNLLDAFTTTARRLRTIHTAFTHARTHTTLTCAHHHRHPPPHPQQQPATMTAHVLHTLRESNITLDHVLDEVKKKSLTDD